MKDQEQIKTGAAAAGSGKTDEIREKRRRMWHAVGVVAFFVILLLLLCFSFWWLRRVLFSGNAHFRLKKVTVQGGNFWSDHENLLARRAGLFPEVNLFSINYARVKKALQSIPSIEKAEITRQLPDRVRITLWERIPRAMLYNPSGNLLVDEKGMVIPRSETGIGPAAKLPVIIAVPGHRKVYAGEEISELKPALDLIMMSLRNFPDIDIVCILPAPPEQVNFMMRYRGGKLYRVILPVQNRGLAFMLSALQTAIINAHWKQINASVINLSFDGQVVLK